MAAYAGDGHVEGSQPEGDLGPDRPSADVAGGRAGERAAGWLSPAARFEALRSFGEAPRQREEQGHGVVGETGRPSDHG